MAIAALAAALAASTGSPQGVAAAVSAAISAVLAFYSAYPRDGDRATLRFGDIGGTRERVRVTVVNDGPASAFSCEGKISVKCSEEDTLDVTETGMVPVFISRREFRRVTGDLLSWERKPNRPTLDISKDDAEQLMVARIVPTNIPHLKPYVIEIPSEEGEGLAGVEERGGAWKTRPQSARVFLRLREEGYGLMLRVGASNAEPIIKQFVLRYDRVQGRLTLGLQP